MRSEVSTYRDVYSFSILMLEIFSGNRPIDHMFSDGLNIYNFVKTALLARVAKIANSLLEQHITNVEEISIQSNMRARKIEECMRLIFEN